MCLCGRLPGLNVCAEKQDLVKYYFARMFGSCFHHSPSQDIAWLMKFCELHGTLFFFHPLQENQSQEHHMKSMNGIVPGSSLVDWDESPKGGKSLPWWVLQGYPAVGGYEKRLLIPCVARKELAKQLGNCLPLTCKGDLTSSATSMWLHFSPLAEMVPAYFMQKQ